MDCRKCGAKHITKRRAGVFFCQHCGMAPGTFQFDRFGNLPPEPIAPEPQKDAGHGGPE